MKQYRQTIINSFILLAIALCFGSTFLFIYLSLAGFNPLAAGSGRILVASICSIIFLYASGRRLPKTLELWIYSAIYGGFCLALPFILIPFALKTLPTGKVAIYLASIPFILLFAKLILKEKVSLKDGWFLYWCFWPYLLISGHQSTISTSDLLSSSFCIIASILLANGGILIQKCPDVLLFH